jgi:phenylacetic acid degradation operon negative regulatory protein
MQVTQGRKRALRPLTARSVVASLLLGSHPPSLPAQRLVSLAALFGVSEGTTRVALSRMAAAGELVAESGHYRLAGRLLERQARQDASLAPAPLPWDGSWRVAVVGGEARSAADRAALRAALKAMRLGELREGVWLRPANLALEADPRCTWLTARPDDDLAGAVWDLPGWADHARGWTDDLLPLVTRLEAGDHGALAESFVVGAAALRHLQGDPLLPAPLLPSDWPADDLRAAYAAFRAAFTTLLSQVPST